MGALLTSTDVGRIGATRGPRPLRTEPARAPPQAGRGRRRPDFPEPQATSQSRRRPPGRRAPLARPGRPERARLSQSPGPAHPARAHRPAHLVLADVVGGDEDADADGDEDEADDEEGRQHRARCQDGLPSRQPLLLESGIVRLAGLHGAGAAAAAHRAAARHADAARGVPVRLLLGAVVHRHGTAAAAAADT